MDREGDPVAKPVVGPAVVALNEQSGPNEGRTRGLFGAELVEQPVSSGRGESELELQSGPPRQAASLEIVHRTLRLRVAPELALKVCVGPFERLEDRLGIVARPAFAATFTGHVASGPAREIFHRLDEFQVRIVHQEPDGSAVRPASEAVVELLVGDDGERGRLLVVERAARLELLAGAPERDVVLDHLDDVGRGDEVVDEGLGDTPRHVSP